MTAMLISEPTESIGRRAHLFIVDSPVDTPFHKPKIRVLDQRYRHAFWTSPERAAELVQQGKARAFGNAKRRIGIVLLVPACDVWDGEGSSRPNYRRAA